MNAPSRPRAALVGVQLPGVPDDDHNASLDELGRLADTLGLDVIARVSQRRSRLEPGAVLGAGKLKALARLTGGSGEVPVGPRPKRKKQPYLGSSEAPDVEPSEDEPPEISPEDLDDEDPEDAEMALPEGERADTVLVDHDLSPSQARNLERATGAEVLDRTSVILGIFHRHARTREAKLEVEIARLRYLSPRLREVGGGGDRQRGGIGGRGAGESALELDRRKIRDRIAELSRELEGLRRVAETQRERRAERRKVALVGYTNAGKSSMMRALTQKAVYVADALFATVGTTVRVLPGVTPRVLVSDTVGFIKKLPHDLVASFRATLEEARSAELVLHVVDASDPAFRSHMEVTEGLLSEISAPSKRLVLFNKKDRLDEEARARLSSAFPDAMLVSAHDPEDVLRVVERIRDLLEEDAVERALVVPWAMQGRLPSIHEKCRVLESTPEPDGFRLRVRGDAETLEAFRDLFSSEELNEDERPVDAG